MNVLDKLPVATLTFIASIVLIVIAYISNDVSFNAAFRDLLFAGGGSLGIGHVRNGAGKGLHRRKRP